jgi:beta-lactamase regulating signal transducer with metallopeptidase domain
MLSGEIDSPIAVGFARPAVILPHSRPAQLSREEMDYVLLRETAHLERWDDWNSLLARLLGAALALHPTAHLR